MTTFMMVIIGLVLLAFAIFTTINKSAHELAPTLASILWGLNVITWIILAIMLYNTVWPVNTYIATAAATLGGTIALVSSIMIIVPLITTWNTRQQDAQMEYEDQKLRDRERILDLTMGPRRSAPNISIDYVPPARQLRGKK